VLNLTIATARDYDPAVVSEIPRTEFVDLDARRETLCVAALLLAMFALRLVRLEQPIVENYVGRQVPTAMVARNLDRGAGFLHPQLDTGPFPNLFVVEPPIYATSVVLVKRLTGLPIDRSGRVASALATVLAGWGLYGLVRRREGVGVALAALGAFGALPLTIRYGRAVQPDMLMLGLIVGGLRLIDSPEMDRKPAGFAFGWTLLALGLATKILAGWVLVPAMFLIRGQRRWLRRGLLAAAVLPALAWYVHAAGLVAHAGGSAASIDNGRVWLDALVPSALFRLETFLTVGRFAGWRSFTPAWPLAAWGFWTLRSDRRFWWSWTIAAALALLVLAGKLHHEYYLLSVAPLVALGYGRTIAALPSRRWGILLAASLLGLSFFVARSTWRTPREWTPIAEAGRDIRRIVPKESLLVATEAVLFASDRRGCRMEFSSRSVNRAAGEWRRGVEVETPEALVTFYGSQGARYVADLPLGDESPDRRAFHNWIRRNFHVLIDRPGLLLAEWERSETPSGGTDAEN
jgi:4-amino-4-deoxy-L-arabinose transferase-like glycosyltransferase